MWAERRICDFNPGGTYSNHWALKGCENTKIPSYCFSPQDIFPCGCVCLEGVVLISLSIVRLYHSTQCGSCSAASSPYQTVYGPTVSLRLLRSPLFERSLRQTLTTPYLRLILVLSSPSRFTFKNYVITFLVFPMLAHILRIWPFFFFSFSHASIDHSSTQDLWAEVVSILPTHLAVSSVQCGFYWRVRGRSVSHARRQLTHPIATSSLTPSTALPCGLKMRQCCSPTDDFETEGGPRGVRSDTDPNLVQWNCAALSNKTKRPLHVTFADVCCSSASWANDALCVFHPERKTY